VKKIRQYSLTRRPQSPQRGEGWCVEKIPPRLLRSLREKNPAVESHGRPLCAQRDTGWNDAQGNLRALSALGVKKIRQ